MINRKRSRFLKWIEHFDFRCKVGNDFDWKIVGLQVFVSFGADKVKPIVSRCWTSSSIVHRNIESANAMLQVVRLRVHQNFSDCRKVARFGDVEQFNFCRLDWQVCFRVNRDARTFESFNVALRLSPGFELRIFWWCERNFFNRDRRIGAHVNHIFRGRSITSHDVIGQRLLDACPIR